MRGNTQSICHGKKKKKERKEKKERKKIAGKSVGYFSRKLT